jgi:hypothetical protein
MSKSIIKVRFADRNREGEFGKQEYTYYLDAGLSVEPGQIITVPTKFGHTHARVSEINLSGGVIDMRYADSMKTITAADLDAAPRVDQQKGENVKPARMPAGTPRQISMSDYDLVGDYGYTMEGDV